MPTFQSWTAHVLVGGKALKEEQVVRSGSIVTCDIPCIPEQHFQISLVNPSSDSRVICVYAVDAVQHDEYVTLPGEVRDVSIGWQYDLTWHYPYIWTTPDKLNVRAFPAMSIDGSKTGVISIRLYRSNNDSSIGELVPDVLLRRPMRSRDSGVHRLSHYAAVDETFGRRMPHPTRTGSRTYLNFHWLKSGKPFLEFNFQYFKDIMKNPLAPEQHRFRHKRVLANMKLPDYHAEIMTEPRSAETDTFQRPRKRKRFRSEDSWKPESAEKGSFESSPSQTSDSPPPQCLGLVKPELDKDKSFPTSMVVPKRTTRTVWTTLVESWADRSPMIIGTDNSRGLNIPAGSSSVTAKTQKRMRKKAASSAHPPVLEAIESDVDNELH
ncbi:hypothetical protein BU17DRAFT_91511 [Hysterangium stoloniferum]|nr:hypothetical protein BU17DRAFT_91511 [Hysterangium stoloniferum]